MKVIKYYRKNVWGNWLEYIHPDHKGDADILFKLTGQKTINSIVRELIRDLSAGQVTFEEVLAPK